MMNKTVLITGSSRGIGRALALYFAKEGYKIALNSRKSSTELEKTKNELLSYNVPVLSMLGDVGNYEFCKNFISETKKILGSVDILINNAGISHIGLFSEMTPNEWNEVISSNLTSVYNLSSLVIPDMVYKKSGKILNISSVWGNVGASMEVAYSASKGGMNSLTKALAKELAPSGIQVNAIACGAIATEMNSFLDEEELNCLIDEIPSSRLGKPDEVAKLAFDLCNENTYLTGQIIGLDGGWC
ncbi:MAG: elongation factor P 5-aminopentanone reductase [Catonella sp.]|uniref:elongation factor P 5-aminopentanone reductase n=1 Tax=Catonella sp. TaxID=2382125 RepID=UPI003FA0A473